MEQRRGGGRETKQQSAIQTHHLKAGAGGKKTLQSQTALEWEGRLHASCKCIRRIGKCILMPLWLKTNSKLHSNSYIAPLLQQRLHGLADGLLFQITSRTNNLYALAVDSVRLLRGHFTCAYWWEERGDINKMFIKHRLAGCSLSITMLKVQNKCERKGEGKDFHFIETLITGLLQKANLNNRQTVEVKAYERKRERCFQEH